MAAGERSADLGQEFPDGRRIQDENVRGSGAPFVSGVAALLLDIQSDCSQKQAVSATSNARQLGPKLGYGRLDVYEAVQSIHAEFP